MINIFVIKKKKDYNASLYYFWNFDDDFLLKSVIINLFFFCTDIFSISKSDIRLQFEGKIEACP